MKTSRKYYKDPSKHYKKPEKYYKDPGNIIKIPENIIKIPENLPAQVMLRLRTCIRKYCADKSASFDCDENVVTEIPFNCL